MIDYFALFKVLPSDNLEETKKKMIELNRKWSRMSNSAPRIEDRRTAEDNLKHLQDATVIFASEDAKQKYIAKLNKWNISEKSKETNTSRNSSASNKSSVKEIDIYAEARASLSDGKYHKAFKLASHILMEDAGNVKACQILLQACLANREKDEQMKGHCLIVADEALSISNDQTIWILLGDIHFKYEEWEKALQVYSEVSYTDYNTLQKRAICLQKLNKNNEAIDTFERLLAHSPKDVMITTFLVTSYVHRALSEAKRYILDKGTVPEDDYFGSRESLKNAKQTLLKIQSMYSPEMCEEHQGVQQLIAIIKKSENRVYSGGAKVIMQIILNFFLLIVGTLYLGLSLAGIGLITVMTTISLYIMLNAFSPIYKLLEKMQWRQG